MACEDQFRNAYLLGCVGAWSLHPVQIDIAKRVFSPEPADVAHALHVIEEMGDGTGAVMIDGKMEDDASVKQCHVMVDLAHQLADRDPDLAELYGFAGTGVGGLIPCLMRRPTSSSPAVPSSTCPAPTSGPSRRPRASPPTP